VTAVIVHVGRSLFMDVAAYARFSNQSEQTVRRWARDGEVPAQKVHGQWRFEVRS
jgi:hypothetical protein